MIKGRNPILENGSTRKKTRDDKSQRAEMKPCSAILLSMPNVK
jgi:hypothetical protein